LNVRQSLDVLGEREFRLLWLGRSLSAVGDALVPVATAFAVLGPGGCRVLVATAGYELVYAIDSATFVASIICLAAMKPLGVVRRMPRQESNLCTL